MNNEFGSVPDETTFYRVEESGSFGLCAGTGRDGDRQGMARTVQSAYCICAGQGRSLVSFLNGGLLLMRRHLFRAMVLVRTKCEIRD